MLPRALLCAAPDQLECVLVHELTHIRRLDAPLKLLCAAALCLHWFNPLVHALYLLLNRDVELACDEAVLARLGRDRRAGYASLLLDLRSPDRCAPLTSGFGHRAVRERIASIMRYKKVSILALALAVVLVFSVAAAFATSAAPAATGNATPFRRAGEEGIGVRSAAVLNGTVYAGNWSGIYRWKPGDAAPTQLTVAGFDEAGGLYRLAADGDKLYVLLEQWNEKLDAPGITLCEATPQGDRLSLGAPLALDSRQLITSYGQAREAADLYVAGDRLYLLALDEWLEKTDTLSFSLADGSCVPLPDLRSWSIVPYKDGKLLVQPLESDLRSSAARIGLFDPQTGRVEPAFEVEGVWAGDVSGLAYDRDADAVYYVLNGRIYAVRALDASTAEPVGEMPLQSHNGLDGALVLGKALYAFHNRDALTVRDLDPGQRATRTLTIKGRAKPDEAYYAFTAEHPDVSVVIDSEYTPPDAILNALVSRSQAADIYDLSVVSPAYQALAGRGYTTRLTDPILLDAVARMYPQVRDAVTADGALIAWPEAGDRIAGFEYSPQALEALKLTEADLPTTWPQMIDLVAHWDTTYGAEFPEATPFAPWEMVDVRKTLMNRLIEDYLAYMQRSGMERFDLPALRSTLTALDAADFSAMQKELTGTEVAYADRVLFSTWGRLGFDEFSDQNRFFWALAMLDGEPPVALLPIGAYVINPFSQNADLAEAYLRARAQYMHPAMRITLMPDVNQALRSPGMEQDIQALRESVEQLKREVEQAKPEDRQTYEGHLKEAEANLADTDKYSWIVSPEMLASYRRFAEHMVVPAHSLIGDGISPEVRSLIDRYIARQLPMEQFIASMDQKLMMMKMEGSR